MSDAPHSSPTSVVLIRGTVLSAVGSLCVVGTLLLVRRLQGGLTQPLAAGTLSLVVGVLLLGGCGLIRSRDRCGSLFATTYWRWLPWIFWVASLLLVATLSLPGTSFAGLGLLWLAAVALTAYLGVAEYRSSAPADDSSGQLLGEQTEESLPETEFPAGVQQELLRRVDPTIGVIIEGRMRAEFAVGQRTASVHVAFCPPLSSVPAVSVEQMNGPAATAKVGLVLGHGARIDVRLEQPAKYRTDVVLAVYAQESPVDLEPDVAY